MLSVTHPLNLQRWICLASLQLLQPSRACLLSAIESSQHHGKTRFVQKNQHLSCLRLTPCPCKRVIYLALLRLVNHPRSCFLSVIEPSEYNGKTRVVRKNHITKLSATHLLNLQKLMCLALLWHVHRWRACFLCVIEPSEHDRKTRVVQKNHLPKLSATHPLNMQRLIGPGSRWLVLSSRTCFMGFIEPYEDDGKTHFVQKNQIPKLSTTHVMNLQWLICLALLRLVNPSGACWLCVIEPSEHDGKTCFVQKNQIKFQSCLPLTPWICKGWCVQPHYDLHILHKPVSCGCRALWTRWWDSLCPDKSYCKVVHHWPPEPAKVDLSSLTMTCTFFRSLYPGGYLTLWTRW